MRSKIGICFSKELAGVSPLSHIGEKLPVYLHFLSLCQKQGWEVYVLTRKTYQGEGVFNGAWLFDKKRFKLLKKTIKIDLVYDRTAGIKFPPEEASKMVIVNQWDFKVLCWDKWKAYQEIGHLMPRTFWVGRKENLASILTQMKTDWVVLKPFNGLKGLGIFIGSKKEALKFQFPKEFKKYIAQEFVDTSKGIPQIVNSLHDLRAAIINGQPVWSHVRVPPQGGFKANAAGGGILKEVDYELIPKSAKNIVAKVANKFYQKYDNPIFSLDFGFDKKGRPWLFEINDQIGFPRWEMKKRDLFLKELVKNFELKLNKKK
jgi:glutathione synthase/RimK-type ligase-like ATP-grasp enzyme